MGIAGINPATGELIEAFEPLSRDLPPAKPQERSSPTASADQTDTSLTEACGKW